MKLILILADALITLAKLYKITEWERWKRYKSGDTDATEYYELNDAVEDHPDICLRCLAGEWGLQFSNLEEIKQVLGKRKAQSDSGSEERFVKRGKGSVKSVIWEDVGGRIYQQNMEEHSIQQIGDDGQIWEVPGIRWEARSIPSDGKRFRDTGRYAKEKPSPDNSS